MNLKHGAKYMRNTKNGVIYPYHPLAAQSAHIEVFVHTDKAVTEDADDQNNSSGSVNEPAGPDTGEGIQSVEGDRVAVVPSRRTGKSVKLSA